MIRQYFKNEISKKQLIMKDIFLTLSLQNIRLKKFLSQALIDEFDDGDILLHKLEISYGKEMKGEELNKLVKKQ